MAESGKRNHRKKGTTRGRIPRLVHVLGLKTVVSGLAVAVLSSMITGQAHFHWIHFSSNRATASITTTTQALPTTTTSARPTSTTLTTFVSNPNAPYETGQWKGSLNSLDLTVRTVTNDDGNIVLLIDRDNSGGQLFVTTNSLTLEDAVGNTYKVAPNSNVQDWPTSIPVGHTTGKIRFEPLSKIAQGPLELDINYYSQTARVTNIPLPA